ncbi:MAG: redoxin domain-containing protein [Anaerolineae bacterium]
MPTNLHVNDIFPDFELPDQDGRMRRLSHYTRPSDMDEKLGFGSGYPVIVVFYRGFFCPRDQQQMRRLVEFQSELKVNYGKLITVSVQPPLVQAAFRAGLGANWPFLSDEQREVIKEINILDETEGEYADPAQPYTFVLRPYLRIHKIYAGWYYIGRPTLDELRLDLRAIMEQSTSYDYEVWNTEAVKQFRIPQKEWAGETPVLGANGLPVASGVVNQFNLDSGNGVIQADDTRLGKIFFNFTAIPGQGYRTLRPGTKVEFEVMDTAAGAAARNIQAVREG